MTGREKLIAILRETEIDNVDGQIIRARMRFVPFVFEKLADNLVANGVIVLDGIPVTERVPEMENEEPVEKRPKAMLSQPMAGKTPEEIRETRERAIRKLEEMGYEVVNTLFTDEWYSQKNMEARGVVNIPMCFLAKSLENMSLCHAAYFCKGWENARGCRIEHEAARAYGVQIIYEEAQG